MQKTGAVLRVVAGKDHPLDRETISRGFRQSMIEHLRAHTAGTNVNPKTLLATDYLNHFNEMIMLLDMLPEAPAEIAADIGNWRHKSYEEHFHETGFRDKSLAIAGYLHAPEEVREAFDAAIGQLEQEMVKVLGQVTAIMAGGGIDGLVPLCPEAAARMRDLVDAAAAIVNGSDASVHPGETHDQQACVDALFD
ncbi:MAG: hypothetical protein AB7O70_16240 [Hyphomicrobiales bacterium]